MNKVIKNNKDCEIVRDLLPLYFDGVCSDASKIVVEEHLAACDGCTRFYKDLQGSPAAEELHAEMEGVIERQNKRLRRKGMVTGWVLASILAIPLLVCFIVNLASGHALDWFFIVLASLLLTASVTVLPCVVRENKFLWSLAGFTVGLMLLLATCALYTKGDWFFVAALSTLFGMSVILLPIVVHVKPLSGVLGHGKGLCVMAADTLLFAAMMTAIGFLVRESDYPRMALGFSLPFVLLAWALFAVLRYLPGGALVRLGAGCALAGVFAFFGNSLTGLLIGSPMPLPVFTLFDPALEIVPDRILSWLMLGGLVLGAILILIGLCVRKAKKAKIAKTAV